MILVRRVRIVDRPPEAIVAVKPGVCASLTRKAAAIKRSVSGSSDAAHSFCSWTKPAITHLDALG